MDRRSFNQCLLAAGMLPATLAQALAGATADPFHATTGDEVVRLLFNGVIAQESDDLSLRLPLQAQAGKAVAATVEFRRPGAQLIALVTDNNPLPLNGYLLLSGASGFFSTLIRVERNSRVSTYVKSADALYATTSQVKVSQGGYVGVASMEKASPTVAGADRTAVKLNLQQRKGQTAIRVLIAPAPAAIESTGEKAAGPGRENHITHVRFTLNGKTLAVARLGPYMAARPFIGIRLPRTQAGDLVAVDWTDKHGFSGHARKAVT